MATKPNSEHKKDGDIEFDPKVAIGYVFGVIAFFACLTASLYIGSKDIVQSLICLLGAVVGWSFGMLISPLNDGEKKQFSEFTKTLSAFMSGFVIAKFDVILQSSIGQKVTADTDLFLIRSMLFAICFFLGALFTFVGRRYVESDVVKNRVRRKELISELRQKIEELDFKS